VKGGRLLKKGKEKKKNRQGVKLQRHPRQKGGACPGGREDKGKKSALKEQKTKRGLQGKSVGKKKRVAQFSTHHKRANSKKLLQEKKKKEGSPGEPVLHYLMKRTRRNNRQEKEGGDCGIKKRGGRPKKKTGNTCES